MLGDSNFTGSLQRSYWQLDFTKVNNVFYLMQTCAEFLSDLQNRFISLSSTATPGWMDGKMAFDQSPPNKKSSQGLQELCNCVGGDFRGNSCYILICTNQESQKMFPTKDKHLMSISKSCLSGRKDQSPPALCLISSKARENSGPNLRNIN